MSTHGLRSSYPAFIPAIAFAIIASLFSAHAQAQEVSDLRDKMLGAYRNVQIYQAQIQHETIKDNGRWRLTRTFNVAFDRSSNSLRIDRPDMLLISDGRFLRYRSEMIPGRHLEAVLRGPLDDAFLKRAAPFLSSHPMPDVTMLLGSDVLAEAENVMGTGWDYSGRAGLQHELDDGTRITYRIDSTTNLIGQMQIELPSTIQRGQQTGPITVVYEITVQKLNEEFDQEWFDFDSANSQAVSDWGDLLDSGEEGAVSLEGKKAPSIELDGRDGRLYQLSRDDASVVVMTFWASWGGPPTYRALPQMQELANWAQQESLPVSVQTVNIREDDEDIAAVWQVKGLTLPVLLDKRGRASHAYRVGPLPQTVIIAGGKVQHVHVGASASLLSQVKRQVGTLLQDNAVSRK